MAELPRPCQVNTAQEDLTVITLTEAALKKLPAGFEAQDVIEGADTMWRNRIRCLEDEMARRLGATEENFDALFKSIEALMGDKAKYDSIACNTTRLTTCLQLHRKKPLQCQQSVESYKACIEGKLHELANKLAEEHKHKQKLIQRTEKELRLEKSLAADNGDLVYKSKLKVLTANIGTLLDLYGVEKGLDHYRSTAQLNFEHFRFYLQNEVFSSVPESISLREIQHLENRIEEVCWLVCRKKYFTLQRHSSVCKSEVTVNQLFRIFCFLGDLVPVSPDNSYQVLMHTSEVGRLAADIAASLGLEWDVQDFESLASITDSFRFPKLLNYLEERFGPPLQSEPLQEAVAEIYYTLIHDVIKKGHLLRRGYLIPTLREYWFVLRTTELSYYKTSCDKECCGIILLTPQSRVDTPPTAGKDKVHRIVIYNGDRSFELAALDHRSRLQWITALHLAIGNSGGKESYQRSQVARRRQQRDAETLKMKEETLRRTSQSLEIQNTKEQLKLEIQAREAADQKARELQDSLEKHENKAKELLDIRAGLEKLLEEETQAKRDEEIVRNLQARVLREEWERREELETLQAEQRRLLEQEREKRLVFEKQQEEKENQLQEAELRLRALESERQSLDKELKVARDKILKSERSKEVLEAKLRVIGPQVRDSDRVRRTLSFMSTARDRPLLNVKPKLNNES